MTKTPTHTPDFDGWKHEAEIGFQKPFAEIVRAVNSYQELVALLKEFVTDLDVNKTSTLAEYSARVYKALDRAEKGE